MKTILVLCAVIVVSISKDITRDSETIKNCLKSILQIAGQKTPEMQGLLDAHQTPFFELVDKYFECTAEPDLKGKCQYALETTTKHFKEELEENIPNKYKEQLDELMKAGEACIFGNE